MKKKLEDLFKIGCYYLTAKEMKAKGMERPLPKPKYYNKTIITFEKPI